MIRGESSHVIGTITVAGQRFQLRMVPTGLATLTQYLTCHYGLILTAPGQVPLVVLRLGDLLRDGCLKGVQHGGPKTSPRVSAPVNRNQPGIGADPYAYERQQQPGHSLPSKKDEQ